MSKLDLFADQVHAMTFAKKVANQPVSADCAAIMRSHRTRLKQAQRFIIDDDSVRLICNLCRDETKMKGWAFLARLPFETVWFEFNLHAKVAEQHRLANERRETPLPEIVWDDIPPHMGLLMCRDSQDPESHRWICHIFSAPDENAGFKGPVPVLINIVFDPEGDGRFPVKGSQLWSSSTLSMLPHFPRIPVKVMDDDGHHFVDREIDPELALLGFYGEDRVDEKALKEPDWMASRLAVTVDPWWACYFNERNDSAEGWAVSYRAIQTEVREYAGMFRWIMAMLAALNGLPRDIKHHEPRKTKHSIGMHQLPFFGSSTVSLTIPTENRLVRAIETLDRAAKIERHRRRHPVRGHWRIIERGKSQTYICRHSPVMVEHDVGLCEKCGLIVRYIHDHERGDATLGYVRPTYEVRT